MSVRTWACSDRNAADESLKCVQKPYGRFTKEECFKKCQPFSMLNVPSPQTVSRLSLDNPFAPQKNRLATMLAELEEPNVLRQLRKLAVNDKTQTAKA
jgi:hypothetical protein